MTAHLDPQLASVCETVQHNCAISDARYARNYSLCIYLLRMREFYRWQQSLPLSQQLSIDNVGDWVSATEEKWDDIEDEDFGTINIDGQRIDPFDSTTINRALQAHGLIYSAGYGRMGQPHFLLAELDSQAQHDNTCCYYCGTELARDIITLPAMAQGNSIYIRRDSITRLLGQMYDEWKLNPRPGAMQRLVEHFALDMPGGNDQQLQTAATELTSVFVQHELGEVAAGKLLGPEFNSMIASFAGLPGEYLLRALRDMLADTMLSWPHFISERNNIYLDFWLAGINGIRQKWLAHCGSLNYLDVSDPVEQLDRLHEIMEREQARWMNVANTVLAHHRENSSDCNPGQIINEALNIEESP